MSLSVCLSVCRCYETVTYIRSAIASLRQNSREILESKVLSVYMYVCVSDLENYATFDMVKKDGVYIYF